MANNQFFPQTNTKALIVGAVGGFFVVALLFIIYLGCNLFNYQLVLQPKYISQEKIIYLDANDSICAKLDSIHRAHYIDSLKNARIVLSPQEYTSNVVDYYNIAFIVMSAMLVIFTALSFIHFRTSIKEAFLQMLESDYFQKNVAETLSGRVEEYCDNWLEGKTQQLDDLSSEIEASKDNLSDLYTHVQSLEEDVSRVITESRKGSSEEVSHLSKEEHPIQDKNTPLIAQERVVISPKNEDSTESTKSSPLQNKPHAVTAVKEAKGNPSKRGIKKLTSKNESKPTKDA